jgi:peptidoglycan/xylan/chitin deacetylase (PgdA/CDA1 family)
VLREHRLPAAVFLVSDFLGSRSGLWWDQLLNRLRAFRGLPAAHRAAVARGLPNPWGALLDGDASEQEFLQQYKTANATQRRAVDDILTAVSPAPYVHHDPIFLSASEIREMQAGGISFGAHSRTHPLLTWLDSDELREELSGSKQSIEALTGKGPCWFAYPDGTFTEREQHAVEELGFAGAVQTFRRPGASGRYAMPRVGLKVASTSRRDGRLAIAKFRCVLAGITRRRLVTVLAQLSHSKAPTTIID